MSDELTTTIVGIIVGILSSIITTRLGYKDIYAKTVSANRMEWINNFREELSIVIAGIRRGKGNCENNTEDIIFQAEKARAKLLTRLNMDISKLGNEYNEVMSNLLNELDFDKQCYKNEYYSHQLIELSRKILEPEWRKVKQEAGGDKCEV